MEIRQVINAPREKVFAAWTDFEAQPKYSTMITKATIAQRQGNILYVQRESKFMGRKLELKAKHLLMPPEREEGEFESEAGTSTRVTTFDAIPGGTQMTAIGDFEFRGTWAKLLAPLFARRRLQSAFTKELQAFAKYVEAMQ